MATVVFCSDVVNTRKLETWVTRGHAALCLLLLQLDFLVFFGFLQKLVRSHGCDRPIDFAFPRSCEHDCLPLATTWARLLMSGAFQQMTLHGRQESRRNL